MPIDSAPPSAPPGANEDIRLLSKHWMKTDETGIGGRVRAMLTEGERLTRLIVSRNRLSMAWPAADGAEELGGTVVPMTMAASSCGDGPSATC